MSAEAIAQAPGIEEAEYRARVERIRERMREHGLDALLLYADSTRQSNVRYVVEFRPIDGYSDISMAVVLIPAHGEPTLFVSFMNLLWGQEVAWFPARTLEELPAELHRLRTDLESGTVGVAGMPLMPVGVHEAIRGAFALSKVETIAAEHVMAPIKARKSRGEIRLLRTAGSLIAVALDAIKEAVHEPGKTEMDVARAATVAIIEAGGDGPAMDIQIQAGLHSSYNNIRSTDRPISPGDSILIEMGTRYKGYVTDIARGATVGEVDPRQVEIIEVAASALEAGCRAVRPGITAGALNDVIEQALTEAGYREFSAEARGYGTGHGIGTDIEEEEPWIRPGSTFVLEQDMAIALKASIFVPGLAGVRVEDNILVSDSGADVYTPYARVLHW
ncbi:MAG: M24 family metallopeptidase [Actinomycetota bacterium]